MFVPIHGCWCQQRGITVCGVGFIVPASIKIYDCFCPRSGQADRIWMGLELNLSVKSALRRCCYFRKGFVQDRKCLKHVRPNAVKAALDSSGPRLNKDQILLGYSFFCRNCSIKTCTRIATHNLDMVLPLENPSAS